MRHPDNIARVAALTPMLIGFIFYEKSPRCAADISAETIAALPGFVHPVGLFVNASSEEIINKCKELGINIVQLHGDETPGQCDELKASGLVVMKAIGISDIGSLRLTDSYHGHVDAFVFDTKSESRGGSGKKFSWHLLEQYHGETPYLLSGGICPDDVDDIIAAMRPGMIGIDINSGFETAPGIKDISKLTRFIITLRQYNEDNTPATPFWTKTK